MYLVKREMDENVMPFWMFIASIVFVVFPLLVFVSLLLLSNFTDSISSATLFSKSPPYSQQLQTQMLPSNL
jgi:hypothetical protein